jgi:uncharacterized protein YjeT (DUF2065 family)
MYTLAEKLRAAGIVIVLAGLLCFPFLSASPKRALSAFTVAADLGLLAKFGIATVAVGIIVFLASFLLRKTP